MKTIYIDMDGVIADFNAYYFKFYKTFIYEDFKKEVMSGNLFEKLPPMKDFNLLVSTIMLLAERSGYNVEILSSTHTLCKKQMEVSRKQKKKWLKNHGIFLKLNVVSKRSDKGDFASNVQNILIDDQMESIDYFTDKGGLGVLFTNVDDTIKQVKNAILGLKIEVSNNLNKQF